MKHAILFYMAAWSVLMLASCSSDGEGLSTEETDKEQPAKIERVTVKADDVRAAGVSTRTDFTLANEKLNFSWKAGDEIGIFPKSTMGDSQVKMTLTTGSGEKTATFTGGGWALRSDVTYAAYYPYNLNATLYGITFSYEGQCQHGNGALAHLGTHDLMVTAPTQAVDEALHFEFVHLNAVAQFNLTLPVAAAVDKLTLFASEALFWREGCLLLSGDTYAYGCADGAQVAQLHMELQEVAATEANRTVTLYMNLPPVDFSAQSVYAVLHSTDNRVYQAPVTPRTLQSGLAYRFDATLVDVTTDATVDAPPFSDDNL